MEIKNLEPYLAEHPFFRGLAPQYITLISGCATNARFDTDAYLFRQGDPADRFYVIRGGHVAIEVASPNLGPITIQTVDDGDVVGWSWLFPPYEWNFDARALMMTRALALDGKCLRAKCDADPTFGYEMMKRFSAVMSERLQATRLQLLDMYKS